MAGDQNITDPDTGLATDNADNLKKKPTAPGTGKATGKTMASTSLGNPHD